MDGFAQPQPIDFSQPPIQQPEPHAPPPQSKPPKKALRQKLMARLSNHRRLIGVSVSSLTVIVTAGILLWPGKTTSITEAEYYRQQLGRIQTAVAIIKEETRKEPSTAKSNLYQDIERYNDALLDSLVACEEMDSHVAVSDPVAIEPYKDGVSQVRQFCSDFEDVSDYARKVSKATRQFIVFESTSLTGPSFTQNNLASLQEILGYTRTDLTKLQRSPLNDPALEEMIIYVENLQKQIPKVRKANYSAEVLVSLAYSSGQAQSHMLNARQYYWNNTIRVDALDRSITRLQDEFSD